MIAVVAALLPTIDPVTMLLEMVPLFLLYELSIVLAVVRRAAARPGRPSPPAPSQLARLRHAMLFDLQGKRRRVVQATYLMLAVLMGGGLVLFGIGGDVSGGLFDAFSDNSGGGSGNDPIEKRIERNEKKAAAAARATRRRCKALVRAHYQLAGRPDSARTAGFPADGQGRAAQGRRQLERYLALEPEKLDASLATVALQIYDPTALNKPKEAAGGGADHRRGARATPAPTCAWSSTRRWPGTRGRRTSPAQKAIELAPKAAAQGGRRPAGRAAEDSRRPQAGAQTHDPAAVAERRVEFRARGHTTERGAE